MSIFNQNMINICCKIDKDRQEEEEWKKEEKEEEEEKK